MNTFNPAVAYETFKQRYLENKDKERIDNGSLLAGSPMYYYCKGCYILIATLPETHIEPAPRYCEPCKSIVQHGLLQGFQERTNQP